MKKILILLSPLTLFPVFSIISCNTSTNEPTIEKTHQPLPIKGLSQPDPSLPDHEKAWINVQLFFQAKASLYAAWKASDVQVYNVTKNNKAGDIIIPGPIGKPDLGRLDPRQNYGFQMNWKKNSIKDDDQNGTKSGTLVLTRAQNETYEHQLTLSGFLKESESKNEKANDHLNPEKAVLLFNRNTLNSKAIKVSSDLYIDEFYEHYKDNLDQLATDFQDQIIDSTYQNKVKLEFKDFYQNQRFGMNTPEIATWYRLVDANDPSLTSGWYRMTWIGFDVIKNNLRTAELFDQYVIDWSTISNMLKISDSKTGYLDVKPSTITDIKSFLNQIDHDMLIKQTLIAKPLNIVGHNDQLGYLEVAFDLNYKNGPEDFLGKENVVVKIYGFKPQS